MSDKQIDKTNKTIQRIIKRWYGESCIGVEEEISDMVMDIIGEDIELNDDMLPNTHIYLKGKNELRQSQRIKASQYGLTIRDK